MFKKIANNIKTKSYSFFVGLEGYFRSGTTPFSYYQLAIYGYQQNPKFYQCVEKRRDQMSELVPMLMSHKTKKQVESHYILDILRNPNRTQDYHCFMKDIELDLCLAGEAFLQTYPEKSMNPNEFYSVRPDRVQVIGRNGARFPDCYRVAYGGGTKEYIVDKMTGKAPGLIHIKSKHPLDSLRGFSPALNSSKYVDIYNKSSDWNLSLLNNFARPSGVLEFEQSLEGNSNLTKEVRDQLEETLAEKLQGSKNAGVPLILEGGLRWKPMSMNNKELDLIKSMGITARDIASSFQVPAELVGIESNTFKNYEEARASLISDTMVPHTKWFLNALLMGLLPYKQAKDLHFELDTDRIPAIQKSNQVIWKMYGDATFITINEKREALGYDPIDDGDVLESVMNQPKEEEDEEDDKNRHEPEIDDDDEDEKTAFIDSRKYNLKKKESRKQFIEAKKGKLDRYTNKTKSSMKEYFLKENSKIFSEIIKQRPDSIEDTITICNNVIDKNRELLGEYLILNAKDNMDAFAKDILDLSKSFKDIKTKDYEDGLFRYEAKRDQYLEEYTGEKVVMISNTSKNNIKRLALDYVETGQGTTFEMASYIHDKTAGINKSRAQAIAKTEVHNLSMVAERQSAKSTGIFKKKEWITSITPETRGQSIKDYANHVLMNSVTVDIDEKFSVPSKNGVDMMSGPGDESAPASQLVNCNCVQGFIR